MYGFIRNHITIYYYGVVYVEIYQTKVKHHKRKNRDQYLITFTGAHGFESDDPVIVLKQPIFDEMENKINSLSNQDTLHKEELQTLENDLTKYKDKALKSEDVIQNLESKLSEAQVRIQELETLELEDYKQKYESLLEEHLSQSKEFNTTQGNLSKAFGVIALQNKEITYYRNRPYTHSLFGRVPKEIKELQASHEVYDTPDNKEDPK